MKKLLLISTLIFSVMFSSASYAGWTKVGTSVAGHTYYVDFERIRKHNGFVYYWSLTDYLKPSPYGDLSYQIYYEADCNLYRQKALSAVSHKQSMGRDTGNSYNPKNQEWDYLRPDSSGHYVLNTVCDQMK